MAFNAGEIVARIKATADGMKAGIKDAKDQIDGLAGGLKKAGEGMTKVGGAMTAVVTGPIVAGAAAFYKLSQQAIGFEQQMNEVFTLLPGISDQAMKEMGGQVKDFAKEFGTLPDEVVPALYQSLSAGIPPDNVFDFLEVAQKAAIGGVTDLTTAVDGISSVVNAYGSDVISAAEVSDLMFSAVKKGKTTLDELSKSLFNVTPVASSLGIEFGDVTAAIATLTAQGIPTSVSTTMMRQALVEMSKEGSKSSKMFEKFAGMSLKEFIAKGGNTQEAMQVMEKGAAKLGLEINDLFGSVEAGSAALALTGKATEMFTENMKASADAAGGAETAFDKMEEGVGRQLEKLKAEWAVLRLELVEKFLPIITDTLIPVFKDDVLPILVKVAEFVGNAAEKFGEMDPFMQKVILGGIALAAVLGPIILIAGKIAMAIAALAPVFTAVKVAFVAVKVALLAIGAPVAIVIAAIVALVAIGIYLYKNWDEIKEKVKQLWATFSAWLSNLWNNMKERAASIWDSIKKAVTQKAQELYTNARAKLESLWSYIKGIPGQAFKWGAAIITGFWNGLKDRFSAAKSWVDTNVKNLLNKFNPFAKSSPSLVENVEAGLDKIMDLYSSVKLPRVDLQAATGLVPATDGIDKAASGGRAGLGAGGLGGVTTINVTGTVRHEGINDEGQLVAVVDRTMGKLAEAISSGDRRIPNRVSLVPG